MTDGDAQTQDALKTAQKLMYESRFDDALAIVSAALDGGTQSVDAEYLRAVCLRYLNRSQEAFEALERLLESAPDFGRAHQERGHLYRAQGLMEKALRAYELACRSNPALTASWRAQADLHASAGRMASAKQAAAQADRLDALPKELFAVKNYIHEGKLLKAEDLCRAFLQRTPHHIEAMRLLAEIGVRFSVLDDAEFLLESALALAPDNIEIRLDYVNVLRKRQKFEAALAQAKQLHEQAPDDPIFKSHYAVERLHAGDFEGAIAMFDEILDRLPNDPATLTSRGHALKTFGKTQEAISSYRNAYRARPDHGDAYFALANLKTYRFTDDEVATMAAQAEASDISHTDRLHLQFALGKAYEDRGQFADAFRRYESGNRLKRLQSRYDADKMTAELAAQIAVCTSDLFAAHEGAGCPAPDPIFIVGLPRAGSTLIEQILASHSMVDGTLELPNVLSLSQRLRGRKREAGQSQYPQILHALDADALRRMGEQYIADTRIHRKGAPFFTDKMPNNFRHLALIHPSERQDYRRPPRADGLLFLVLQTALRRRSGVYLWP